jgi:CO dehydrogenase/acetyl-CoA synthase delta subunit
MLLKETETPAMDVASGMLSAWALAESWCRKSRPGTGSYRGRQAGRVTTGAS